MKRSIIVLLLSTFSSIVLYAQPGRLKVFSPKVGRVPDFSAKARRAAEQNIGGKDAVYLTVFGCSWYCGGGPAEVRASSHLKPDGRITYVAGNAHDFTLKTAWVEGKEGDGIGEYLEYVFKGGPPLTTVLIHNGIVLTKKLFKENSRVKTFKLYINNKPYALLKLKDTRARQSFKIGSFKAEQGKELVLKFEIVDVYRGTRYRDTAISELEFDGTGVH